MWLAAGKLGVDQRQGVGVDGDGLPAIHWCPVGPGRVALEDDGGTFAVPDFQIAQFPVTNAQFQAFVDAADGYGNPDWWEAEWREQGWVDLDSPGSSRWTEPTAPREQVSWHEAVAFSRWLDCKLRERGGLTPEQQIRLPTEWEWQQAATGGDPARKYPWDADWNPDCLNAEYRLRRTTAVGIYPDGASPCGALDMAGNVWEWCLNQYDKPIDTGLGGTFRRVARGGSWDYDRDFARAA